MTAPVCLADVEELAAARCSAPVWDFVAGGSGAELTLAANRSALDNLAVVPRVLAGPVTTGSRARLLGSDAEIPLAVAPMAYQRMLHPAGELAVAAAAKLASVPFAASTLSSYPIEQIAAVGANTWFQLYWLRERERVIELVRRAEESGCTALLVTVDVPIMGRRLRDVRNGFRLPASVRAANLDGGARCAAHGSESGGSAIAAHTSTAFAEGLGWRELEWLRGKTTLPLAVKGILDTRDARLAVDAGAEAIIVSNHGGRQLDGAPSAVTVFSEVAAALDGAAELLLDGGIRSGTDILRALALGASGVLVGRPLLWGLAFAGESGAATVLELLRTELDEALTIAGCPDLNAARSLRTIMHATAQNEVTR